MILFFRPHLGASPDLRASRPPTPLRGLGGRVFVAFAYRLVHRAFGMPPRSGGYAQKTTLVGTHYFNLRAGSTALCRDDEDPQGITNN